MFMDFSKPAIFFLSLIALLAAPITALAEPSSGYLIGQEGDFLQFRCSKENDYTVQCEFTQVMMSLKAKPEDLEDKLSRLDDILPEFETEGFKEGCEAIVDMPLTEMLEAAQSGDKRRLEELGASTPDFDATEVLDEFGEKDPREIQDMLTAIDALAALCEKPSKENAEHLIRLEHEKESRTCKLWINDWEDTFERVSDRVWAIQSSGPRGACGVVRLDRFECEEKHPRLCNFLSEKKVLNPEGMPLEGLGSTCGMLSEGVFEYSWKRGERYLDCEVVEY
jgi:hypothetical protein